MDENNRTKNSTAMDRVAAYIAKVEKDGLETYMFTSPDDLAESIGTELDAFPKYVFEVVKYDTTTTLAGKTMKGQEFRDIVSSVDRKRSNAHNRAIDAVNILNRMFAKAGVEPLADIDTSDRYSVADFAGKFTIEAFCRQIYSGNYSTSAYRKACKDGHSYGPDMTELIRTMIENTKSMENKD